MNDSNSYLRNNTNSQNHKETNSQNISIKKDNRFFRKIPKIIFLPLIFIIATVYIYYLSISFSYVENSITLVLQFSYIFVHTKLLYELYIIIHVLHCNIHLSNNNISLTSLPYTSKPQ